MLAVEDVQLCVELPVANFKRLMTLTNSTVCSYSSITVVTSCPVGTGFTSDACCGAFTVFAHRGFGGVT